MAITDNNSNNSNYTHNYTQVKYNQRIHSYALVLFVLLIPNYFIHTDFVWTLLEVVSTYLCMQPQATVFLKSMSSESKFCQHTWISHEILLSLCAGLLLNWIISRFEQVIQFSVIVGNKTWGVISSVMEIHVSLLYSLIIISSTSKIPTCTVTVAARLYSYTECGLTHFAIHQHAPQSEVTYQQLVTLKKNILLVQLYNLAFINPLYCMSDV